MPTTEEGVDMEALHARYVDTHRHCVPSGRFQQFEPRPVPPASRSPTGAPPTDHQRCFSATPMVPPISGTHGDPTPGAEGLSLWFPC